jgi:hypothetical protein
MAPLREAPIVDNLIVEPEWLCQRCHGKGVSGPSARVDPASLVGCEAPRRPGADHNSGVPELRLQLLSFRNGNPDRTKASPCRV